MEQIFLEKFFFELLKASIKVFLFQIFYSNIIFFYLKRKYIIMNFV